MENPDWLPLVQYYQDHAVPQRYNAAVVVASIAVSLLGSYTTLLLLGRRTSKAGLRNLALLLMAAGTMAGVGIWGMHFIGMHVRLEAQPGVFWYLKFNPLWTLFSLFVPLLALICAFIFLGSQDQFSWIRVVPSGIFFGGICATMHFTAAFNSNFKVTYAPLQTVFAVCLACFAATVSLIVFFRWRSQWQDNWWKRLLCATILAAGVSSMHYCAVGGTSYYVKMDRIADLTSGQRTSTIMSASIGAMCGVLCLISVVVVFLDMRQRRTVNNKARKIIVASAIFDKKGSLLVKADGTLPMQVVYAPDMPKDMVAELDIRQPTFQWLFSLSWDWSILDPFADRIAAKAFGLSSSTASSAKAEKRASQPLYAFTSARQYRRSAGLAAFKDRFLECTFLLAHELGLSYHNMGILFDKTIATGTALPQTPNPNRGDEEKGFGREDTRSLSVKAGSQEGAMLVLVREVSSVGNDTVESYIDKGFRFSETRFLAPVLADKLGMDRMEVAGLLRELKSYAKRGGKPVVQPRGVYVGVFAVQPSNRFQGGVDALVYGFARHQCPAYRLPDVASATPVVKEWLASMMGNSMETIRQSAFDEAIAHNEILQGHPLPDYLDKGEAESNPDSETKSELAAFQTALYIAIDAMCVAMRVIPDLANKALLSSELLEVPSSGDDSSDPAQMILFHTVVPPTDQFTPRSQIIPEYGISFTSLPTFVFTPFTLFSRAQSALVRGKASKDFLREVRVELFKRYPNHLDSPSLMDEIYSSPRQAKRHRHSVIDMSPIIDRTKSLARIWDKKDGLASPKEVSEKTAVDEVQLNVLSSPITTVSALRNKRNSAPVLILGQSGDLDSPVSPTFDKIIKDPTNSLQTPEQARPSLSRRASTGGDILYDGTPPASGQWITPPPAFPASAVTRRATPLSTPPSFTSSPGRPLLRHTPSSKSASQALLLAMGENIGTPGSLPAYRSPGNSPPPLVPLPTVPVKAHSPRFSQVTVNLGKARAARRSVTARREEGNLAVSSAAAAKPLAAAARLRSDGWAERAMGEIVHSTNARELFGAQRTMQ